MSRERVLRAINGYNALAEKHDIKSRLSLDGDNLVLASEGQLEYGVYQCMLAEGLMLSYVVVNAMDKQLCFERGE